MTTKLATPSIAILIANGFDESHITAIQRALTVAELSYHMVAPEQGLVNGWQDNAWGHYFTVDQAISTAMGSDYDGLILIGGERGINKLKENLHARRIVNHFLEARKPVSAIGAGVELLALSPKSAGLSVSATEESKALLGAANMEVMEDSQTQDNAVLTSNGSDVLDWAKKSIIAVQAYVKEIAAQEEEAA